MKVRRKFATKNAVYIHMQGYDREKHRTGVPSRHIAVHDTSLDEVYDVILEALYEKEER